MSVTWSVWSSMTSMPGDAFRAAGLDRCRVGLVWPSGGAAHALNSVGADDRQEVAGAPRGAGCAGRERVERARDAVGDVRGRDLARLEVGAGEHRARRDPERVDEPILGDLGHAVGEAGLELA